MRIGSYEALMVQQIDAALPSWIFLGTAGTLAIINFILILGAQDKLAASLSFTLPILSIPRVLEFVGRVYPTITFASNRDEFFAIVGASSFL
jgi:hypothetical protein